VIDSGVSYKEERLKRGRREGEETDSKEDA